MSCPGLILKKKDGPAGKNRLSRSDRSRKRIRGFSLVEIMLGAVLLSIIMLIGVQIFGQISTLWGRTVEQAKAFQSARLAFDLLTRNLGQATLNTYLDYMDVNNNFPSEASYDTTKLDRYVRRSNLHFVSALAGGNGVPGLKYSGTAVFFQAPLGFVGSDATYMGLDQALSVCGYYVEFGDNTGRPPHTSSESVYRYRLKQMLVPSQKIDIFKDKTGGWAWFKNFTADNYSIADNIIALIVRPQYPSDTAAGTNVTVYAYDSRQNEKANPQPSTANQMPPLVQVSMVAIDEVSALRLQNGSSEPQPIKDALQGKFQESKEYDKDLADLKGKLSGARINYHIFSSTLPIRESKWSK